MSRFRGLLAPLLVAMAVLMPIALSTTRGARAQAKAAASASSASSEGTASTSASASSSGGLKMGAIASAVVNKTSSGVGPEVPDLPDTLPDASAFEGKAVASVKTKLEGVNWTKPPVILHPKAGEKFSLAVANAELDRLLATGGFASGSLDVAPGAGGVDVLFRLVPSRQVKRVTLHGNVLPEDDVKRAANLGEVHDVTELSLDEASTAIRAYYARRGFPSATVEAATIETDKPLVVIVDLKIEPGEPTLVRARVFTGLPEADEAALLAAQDFGVHVGDRVDEETLDASDRTLTTTLRGAGYVGAVVTHAVDPPTAAGVEITINISAGSKIVPRIDGAMVFDREALDRILDLEKEPDRSPSHLASKLVDAYRKRGYLDVTVTPELLGEATDSQRTLRFTVREGTLVKVEKRLYPCLRGALDGDRLDEEIDSYLDEALGSGGVGDVNPNGADDVLDDQATKGKGARPYPDVEDPPEVFIPDTYDRAIEHLKDLFRSEGYIFAEVSPPTLVRGACAAGSKPGACKVIAPPPLPDVCRSDLEGLPLESAAYPKTVSCVPDLTRGIECAPFVTVVIPVNPGPRSVLWDVAFDGTKAISPKTLGEKVAYDYLRLGEPLSLKDIEDARRAINAYYRDEGYAFSSVRATLEYSSDKSRARVRFVVAEGEQVIIDEIQIQGHRLTLESLVRARLVIKEGGIYRQKLAGISQERLGQLGVFSSVSIGLINPTIPAKHKNVLVSLVERKPSHIEMRPGYSTGEGFRYYAEYGYANLFGYAVSFDFKLKLSYQPFLGCGKSGVDHLTGETNYDCGQTTFYDPLVVRRWNNQLSGLDRIGRRISVGLTLPHSPIFGAPVRTTLEFVNSLDLFRDFKLDRYTPILTFTYQPIRWFAATFAGDLEYNKFLLFDKQSINNFLATNPRFSTLLRVPDGDTGVAATRATFLFDFRDSRLGATKGWYLSFTNEYVKNIVSPGPRDVAFATGVQNGLGATVNGQTTGARQDFLHITGATGVYIKLGALPKKPVLAFELKGGMNVNVFSCASNSTTLVRDPLGRQASGGYDKVVNDCETYPDRLFYLGGVDSNRGFFTGQMLAQDSIDELTEAYEQHTLGNVSDLSAVAPRGGNVYINPRIELRIPAFNWGGFVLFLDAANSWLKREKFLRNREGHIEPLRLRYSVGPGLSIDTPVGPIALDLGINLNRYGLFNEPAFAFNFSIGRF